MIDQFLQTKENCVKNGKRADKKQNQMSDKEYSMKNKKVTKDISKK